MRVSTFNGAVTVDAAVFAHNIDLDFFLLDTVAIGTVLHSVLKVVVAYGPVWILPGESLVHETSRPGIPERR